MSLASSVAQPSSVPTVHESRVFLPQHAGCGSPGSKGAGRPEHPTKDAPAARRAQLGEAELRRFTR